jgi:hypothetical protein
MLLDAFVLGEAVSDEGLRRATRRDSQGQTNLSLSETSPARNTHWTLVLRAERITSVNLFASGPFDDLARDYDQIDRLLRARYGSPTNAPPTDDEQRHVPLLAEGLPCDRYWMLRTMDWTLPSVRAALSLSKAWPDSIELVLRLESH